MAGTLRRIFGALLATAGTTGELGTIANWEQHLLPGAWERPEAELAKKLGGPVPADCVLARAYDGPLRVAVPAVRTSLDAGEPLALEVLVLSKEAPVRAELLWRPMGRGAFHKAALEHKTRGVYAAALPPPRGGIEYYVEVEAGGGVARFPVTAPGLAQTVIVLPAAK